MATLGADELRRGRIPQPAASVRRLARMRELDIKPELEIYDTGHFRRRLWAEDSLAEPCSSARQFANGPLPIICSRWCAGWPPGRSGVIATGKANMELTVMAPALG